MNRCIDVHEPWVPSSGGFKHWGRSRGHTYVIPVVLGITALGLDHALLGAVALIWMAHVGIDLALGYGLRKRGGFLDTHLSPSEDEGRSPVGRRGLIHTPR